MEHWTEYTRFFTALFVILDPFAAVPLFLVLTKSYSARERRKVVNITALTVLLVLVAASFRAKPCCRAWAPAWHRSASAAVSCC